MTALVDPAALRAEFSARGYVHLRGHYDAGEIAALAAELRRLANQRADADVLDVGGLKFHAGLIGRSPFLQAMLSAPKALAPLCAIAGPDLWVRWDQAVEKRPGAGVFPWHQDNSYSGLVDAHFQYWVSLTRMTADNGGLWLIPGSHARRLPHGRDGAHTVHEPRGGTPELVAAEPGDVVVFSSFLLHRTTPNTTTESRWAYVAEYMRGRDVDPFLPPPFFFAARNGAPAPAQVAAHPAAGSLRNRIKYARAWWRGATWRQQHARGDA